MDCGLLCVMTRSTCNTWPRNGSTGCSMAPLPYAGPAASDLLSLLALKSGKRSMVPVSSVKSALSNRDAAW